MGSEMSMPTTFAPCPSAHCRIRVFLASSQRSVLRSVMPARVGNVSVSSRFSFARVTNVGGSPTSNPVTVTETPPAGLTVTAMSGSGWTCTVATRTCTRADVLAPTASYTDITVTANIAANAVGTLVNSAVVSGGRDSSTANNTGTSPITVGPIAVPALPRSFAILLISALLAIGLWALRARRFRVG